MTILRSTTFQLEVKNEDGVTKMRTFSRVVTDAKDTTERLNKTLGDNVTVTSKTATTTAELTRQARAQVTQIERTNRAYKSQTEQLRHQINMVGKSEEQQAQLNAQFKLGENATEQQREEVAKLTKELSLLQQEENEVLAASDERIKKQKQLDSELERSNKIYKEQAEQLRHQINLIDKTESEQAQLNAQFRLGSNATEEQRQEIAQLAAEYQRLTQAQGDTQGPMSDLIDVAQNFGWQVQDVVVQMQMGIDAFIIFSQQGSQIASSFGAWGALAGAGIAIIGAAIPPLIAYLDDTTTSTEDLEDAQKSLNEIFKTSKYSVKGYTDELVELFEIDEQLADLKVRVGIFEAGKVIKSTTKEIKDLTGEFVGMTKATGGESKFLNFDQARKELGLTKDEFNELQKAYTSGDSQRVTDVFTEIANNSSNVTDEFIAQALRVGELGIESNIASDEIDKLNSILTDGIDPLLSNKDSVRSLSDEYKLMTNQLGMTDRQLAVDNFLRNEALKLTPEQIVNTVKSMNAYFDEADAIKFRTQALEDDMKFEQERLKSRNTVLDPIEQSFDFNGGGNVVEQELQRNKEVTEALSAQMIRTKEWEYSERAKINRLMEAEENRHLTLLGEAQMQLAQTQVMTVSSTVNMMSSLVDEMSDGGERVRQQMEEMNGAQKAMFFLTRSIMAVEAFINGILLGSKLATIFPTAAPAMISLGTGIGAAQSGAIMGSTFAGFFDDGGFIPQGQSGIVSEYRDELVNGVMVKGPARVTSSEETAKMMNGGSFNVNVINNAPGVRHTAQQIDEKTVKIIAEETFNKNIDKGVASSLSKKGSKTDKAMRRNYNTSGKY